MIKKECLAVLVLCAIFSIFCAKNSYVLVRGFQWERKINVESFGPVIENDWAVPAGGVMLSTVNKVHHQESYRCFGPYYGFKGYKVGFHNCTRNVEMPFYNYRIEKWHFERAETAVGNNQGPDWPKVSFLENEREGGREEKYILIFSKPDDSGLSQYVCSSKEEWNKFVKGERYRAKFSFSSLSEIGQRISLENN